MPPPTFPTAPAPDVPGPPTDVVHFRIEVDRSRCKTTDPGIEERLQLLEKEGLSISIAQLVANANLHFAGSVQDEGEGVEAAQMRQAWQTLRGWNLKSVPHVSPKRANVLVVEKQTNSRITALRSEILAIGVALEIGIRAYEIEYPYWALTPGLKRYDLAGEHVGGHVVSLEARGRIDRTNVDTAVSQVHKKFAEANFSKAAGVIFFPRTTNGGRGDILVLDPDGNDARRPAYSRYRSLLLHYVPFFVAQGDLVRRFGNRLKELSSSSDQEFANYLRNGDSILSGQNIRQGHSGYNWNGVRYVGTFFRDLAWPEWLTHIPIPSEGGVFFWGLAREVLDRLRDGQLQRLKFTTAPASVRHQKRVMSIEMPDKTLLIWGPTKDDLDLVEDQEPTV